MTKNRVTLLDYGMANMLNVSRAFEHCGADIEITENPAEALRADRLVVPGVGAFQHSISAIRNRGFDDAIRRFVDTGRPLFGICVGMQVLFDASEEFGEHLGLGILPGRVMPVPRISVSGSAQRVPHIGWNHLIATEQEREWSGTLLQPYSSHTPAVYFVHSFAAQPGLPSDRLADCLYGGHRICAAVQRANVMATQFHPERSGSVGLSLIKHFVSL